MLILRSKIKIFGSKKAKDGCMMTDDRNMTVSNEYDRAFGCIFCITGKEEAVAEAIRKAHPDVRAITARQEKHKTENGRKTRVQVLALPSYVFFEAPFEIVPSQYFHNAEIIRVLKTGKEDWQLRGKDEQFVRWLFAYDGLIGFSKACREGDRIRIVSGSLKDLEGQIKRVDKRGRSGQVDINFNGRSTLIWLGFELIEDLAER